MLKLRAVCETCFGVRSAAEQFRYSSPKAAKFRQASSDLHGREDKTGTKVFDAPPGDQSLRSEPVCRPYKRLGSQYFTISYYSWHMQVYQAVTVRGSCPTRSKVSIPIWPWLQRFVWRCSSSCTWSRESSCTLPGGPVL